MFVTIFLLWFYWDLILFQRVELLSTFHIYIYTYRISKVLVSAFSAWRLLTTLWRPEASSLSSVGGWPKYLSYYAVLFQAKYVTEPVLKPLSFSQYHVQRWFAGLDNESSEYNLYCFKNNIFLSSEVCTGPQRNMPLFTPQWHYQRSVSSTKKMIELIINRQRIVKRHLLKTLTVQSAVMMI